MAAGICRPWRGPWGEAGKPLLAAANAKRGLPACLQSTEGLYVDGNLNSGRSMGPQNEHC